MPVLLIPVYNEEAYLPRFLLQIKPFFESDEYKVLFVNDGSNDRSSEIINNFIKEYANVYFISHNKNKGLSKAIVSGLKFSLNRLEGFFPVITIDADGQHNLQRFDYFLNYFYENSLDFLSVSRNMKKYSLYKRTGNKILSSIASFLLKKNIADIETGYRIISKKAANVFVRKIIGIRYSIASEMCYIAAKNNLNFENTGEVKVNFSRSRTRIYDFFINLSLGLYQHSK